MQIGASVFLLFGLQLLILPFQLISYASRKTDFRRRRFLVFSLVYLSLNSTWIGVHLELTKNYVPRELLSISSIVTILYTYYYFTNVVGLKTEKKNVLALFLHVSAIAITISTCTILFGELTNLILLIILVYMEFVIFYFTRRIILTVRIKKSSEENVRRNAVVTAAISTIFIPFVFFFLNNHTLQYISMNVGFLIITFSYIYVHIKQTQKDWYQLEQFRTSSMMDELEKNRVADTLKNVSNLTTREIEVAELMIQGLMWKEIAGKLNISEKTATKHGSNIYSKFKVSKREDFIEQFKSLIQD